MIILHFLAAHTSEFQMLYAVPKNLFMFTYFFSFIYYLKKFSLHLPALKELTNRSQMPISDFIPDWPRFMAEVPKC